MATVERLTAELAKHGIGPRRAYRLPEHLRDWTNHPFAYEGGGNVVVDEIGIGAGICDRLRELEYDVRA